MHNMPGMHTAYKYGNPDRQLNVVILSDGMTEQNERQELIRLIQTRPQEARVFCIGIGNEVNRPLLEQIAQDSGGLAAFISRGDNFERQAKAFRRKLMRPAATDLTLTINGVRAYDIEPEVIPNLYHGSPVRIYGRYSGGGDAEVTLSGNVRGVALKKSATLSFLRVDTANPEIERMWAWHRIDQLNKAADRTGARDQAVGEIIRLGEEYSIVTEYTSFLVLENDAEYQRWKIDRRNSRRLERDRKSQSELQARLESIRRKAVADLGPQPERKEQPAPQAPSVNQVASSRPAVRTTPSRSNPSPSRSSGFDFSPGTGPVGLVFAGLAAWLAARRKKDA